MNSALRSPSSILRRVSYPVEAFRFKLVPRELAPPLFQGERDGLWQPPDLFDQVNACPADQFNYVHKVAFARDPGKFIVAGRV
jgi:hypothetical protein